MKGILIVYLAANALSSAQMVTYNEIHSELAEDCAFELDATDSMAGDACLRYFAFLETSRDLRVANREWLSTAALSAEERTELLHFVERGNRAMSYIVTRSESPAH